jgi:hypothetical protein
MQTGSGCLSTIGYAGGNSVKSYETEQKQCLLIGKNSNRMRAIRLITLLVIFFGIFAGISVHWGNQVSVFHSLIAIGVCVAIGIATILAMSDSPKHRQ